MASIVMLDIDGPMIPLKSHYLPNQTHVATVFDPCAVGMLLHLLDVTGARIVISSSHRLRGKDHILKLFEINGIPAKHLHRDWHTPMITSYTRSQEIQMWISDHSSNDLYVAIDDETLDENIVSTKCCTYEGFSLANLLECKLALNAYDPKDQTPVDVQRDRWRSTLQFIRHINK